ncbi:MAG: ribosome-associated translation inhibitor RaiA [Bacteroidota bacterium]
MKVTIQSIHFTAAERLKNYVQKKCDKFDQFFDRIIEGKVSLKLQKEAKGANKLVEIFVHVPGDTLVSKETGSTFEEAVDLASEKMKKQIKRYKEKTRSYA